MPIARIILTLNSIGPYLSLFPKPNSFVTTNTNSNAKEGTTKDRGSPQSPPSKEDLDPQEFYHHGE